MELNLPTIIIAAIIAAAVIGIIVSNIRKAKKGEGSCACSGGCSGCQNSSCSAFKETE